MDLHVGILLIITAAILGAVITCFVSKKRYYHVQNGDISSDNDTSTVQKQIDSKEDKISELSLKICKLESELSEQLKMNEILMAQNDNEMITSLKNTIEKLKKDLNEAEAEIENLEDDISSDKRKIDEQRKKLNESEHRVNIYENEQKKLQTTLETVEYELKDKSIALSKKEEAIAFVNEILKAKDADNKDVKEINKKVGDIESYVENDLCAVFSKLRACDNKEEEDIKKKTWQWANLQRKTWLQNKKVIAFVGEFSAGKTSIVNRILSQDDKDAPQLPVSSKATTAIATYISYGSDFNSQFTDPNGKLKNIERTTFEKVNKEILEEIEVSPIITYFVMSYNNKNLSNISILDTPGFNSTDKEDARRTADVIREADALFWVFDANVGEINQTSLEIIREHLQGLPLYVIINKADTKSPNELKKLQAHIKNTLEKNNIKVEGYLQFSQKNPIDKLMNIINGIPQNDNRNEYLFELYYKLTNIYEGQNTAYLKSRNAVKDFTYKDSDLSTELEYKIEDICDECNQVRDMPNLTSRLFGLAGNYYKMSQEEFAEFADKLEGIVNASQQVKDLSDEIKENVSSLQNIQNELDDIKDNMNLVTDTKSRFEKLLKNNNPNFEKEYWSWVENKNRN